jgi:hypothetical protein
MSNQPAVPTVDGMQRIVRTVRRVEAMPRAALESPPLTIGSGTAINWRPGKNLAEETIPALSCVRTFTGADVDGVRRIYAYKPSTTFYTEYALTPNVDCASGGLLGLCFETGLVKYDTGTPVAGEGWGPKPGQYTISKGFPGFRILDVIDATNKIALVRPVPIMSVYAVATAAMSAATLATGNKYKILVGTPGTHSDGGWTTVPDLYIPGGAIANAGKLWNEWTNNGWYGGKVC